jgi:hypothetical protein
VRRALLLSLLAAAALASCGGGGGNSEDAERLLDQAFSHSIRSADLTLDAKLQLKGSGSLDRPVEIKASGPFRTNEGKLPSADLALEVGSAGGGQTVQTGFLSTGDRAFVKFEDVYYEQPPARVAAANRSIGKRKGSLRSLGLDPRSWLADAEVQGDERVAGVDTQHVSGTLDVEKLMRNINEFVRRSARAIGGATGQTPPDPLSAKDIRTVSDVVEDPEFDVYVGKEDDTIRRISGKVEFDVPEKSRRALGGIEGGSLDFSVEFADVNGDQRIEAPANSRPLSELTGSLGGGGLLGGSGGSSGGAGPAPVQPDAGGGTSTLPAPDADAFKRYADCLDKAAPEDTAAIQTCAKLLQR